MKQIHYLAFILALFPPICQAYHAIEVTIPTESNWVVDSQKAQSYRSRSLKGVPVSFSTSSKKQAGRYGHGNHDQSATQDSTRHSSKGKSSGKATKKSSKKSSKKTSKKSSSNSEPSPNGSDSSDSGDSRPPTPVDEPTRPPSQTFECDEAILLSPYSIEYTLEIENGEMPSADDFRDLSIVVERVISEYMGSQYSTSQTIFMTDFETLTGNTEFRSPVLEAEYDSQACFSEDSEEIPSKSTLDGLLANMLSTQQDQDIFITTVSSLLPSDNIFKTILVGVEFGDDPESRSVSSGKAGRNGTVIGAAAAGFTLLVAGIVIYKRRGSEGVYIDEKGHEKVANGDATVAGETYTGESYVTTETYNDGGGGHCEYAAAAKNHQHEEKNRLSNLRQKETRIPSRGNCLQTSTTRNQGPLSRSEWKTDLVGGGDEMMKQLDEFLNDDSDDEQLRFTSRESNYSRYRDELNVANESLTDSPLSDPTDSVEHEPYSVDQIEAMLSYPI